MHGVTTVEEEAPSMGVISQGVSGEQASRSNYNPQEETIIPVQEGQFHLTSNELENLRSLDKADEFEATGQPLIRKAPSLLSRKKDFRKYFRPKMIAIGPLHHDDPDLKPAEKLKHKLASHFIRTHDLERKILYSKIKEEIEDLKKCYDPEEIKKYDDEKLTWMFFLDGCAVLQAIYLRHDPDEGRRNESKALKIKIDLLTLAYVDFFLLENQIPYRVLRLLTSLNCAQRKLFKESIESFIDNNVMTPKQMQEKQRRKLEEQKRSEEQLKPQQENDPAHLLALLRARLLGEINYKGSNICSKVDRGLLRLLDSKSKDNHHSHTFRNIKELRAAGIWLKPSETSSFKDVSFQRVCFVGKLWLPPIEVDDSTGPKFMNLIAYEMCPDFSNEFEVTTYICFLDFLIDEAEDVKALRDAGILYNGLGSDEEVAKLFNKLNTDLVPNPDIYSKVMKQIHRHCKNMWINYAAQAYHTHFTSPWTFLAFVAAIAALLLSALQTYYTINPMK